MKIMTTLGPWLLSLWVMLLESAFLDDFFFPSWLFVLHEMIEILIVGSYNNLL